MSEIILQFFWKTNKEIPAVKLNNVPGINKNLVIVYAIIKTFMLAVDEIS